MQKILVFILVNCSLMDAFVTTTQKHHNNSTATTCLLCRRHTCRQVDSLFEGCSIILSWLRWSLLLNSVNEKEAATHEPCQHRHVWYASEMLYDEGHHCQPQHLYCSCIFLLQKLLPGAVQCSAVPQQQPNEPLLGLMTPITSASFGCIRLTKKKGKKSYQQTNGTLMPLYSHAHCVESCQQKHYNNVRVLLANGLIIIWQTVTWLWGKKVFTANGKRCLIVEIIWPFPAHFWCKKSAWW